MDPVEATVEGYIASWNATDASERRALIDRTWTADGSYVDPVMQGSGPTEIDAMLAGVQERFPAHEMRLAGPVDKHHDRIRFAWALYAPEGNAPFIAGVDFGTVDGDGRLRSITGFIDVVPAL